MPFLCKFCEPNVGAKLSTAQHLLASSASGPCTSTSSTSTFSDQSSAAGRCSFCLGLLDDDELHDKIVDEAVRQLRREGHEAVNFVLALNVPMSVLLREAVVERLLEPAWAAMSMSPKELLSRQLMPKIGKATGLRPSLNSDLTLTVTLENDEFVQSDFDFLVLHFPDEFMRGHAPKRRRRGGGSRTPTSGGTNAVVEDHAVVDMASSLLTKMKIKAARDQMSRAVANIFKFSPASLPCTCKSVTLERLPLFIGGRYCKYSRALPQSPWIGASDEEAPPAAVVTNDGGPATVAHGTATVEGIAIPATSVHGTATPATVADGTAIPATSAHGTAIPATVADGIATPAIVADGTAIPATSAHGTAIPATVADGIATPAIVADGTATPAIVADGTATPAIVADGTATPAIVADGTATKAATTVQIGTLPTAARHILPQSSISEKIAGAMVRHFGADGSRFIASGREDIDVRMLGNGRPFAVQLLNARKTACLRTRASAATALSALAAQINASEERTRDISVHALAHVSAKQAQQLNVGQEEKRKTYSALCCTRTPLVDDVPLRTLHAHPFPVQVAQRTVVRVLRRRPLIDRTRFVYAMRAFALDRHHFVLRLETQAGTYVKEFVHSDFGRTRPSVAQLMGLELGQVDIVQLDVLNVDLEWPPIEQQKMGGNNGGQTKKEEEKADGK
ncbi:hypothetical protein niasHS_006325 [Heterodera schachtii]|uniref:tRNA pseudouridine(55) synthase n=1 Tax=Heterodera schachtii TaxID=97005 RepID=A0ABD2JX32_HETSC